MKKLNLAIIGQGRSGKDIHGRYYISEDNIYFKKGYDKTAKNKYAVTPPEHDINIPLFTGTVLKAVRRYNDLDRIYYLSGDAKSNIGGIL